MKRILFLMMTVAALVLLSGCNLIGYDEVLDNNQVVAKGKNITVTKGEWSQYRDYMASYYSSYYGMNVDKSYFTDSALQQLIESKVISNKMTELGITPLSEEDTKDVESYADSMMSLYKQMVRYQNYPDVETVEEEAARLAEASATTAPESEATSAPETAAEATAAPAETAAAEETVAEATAVPEATAAPETVAETTAAPEATAAAEETVAEETAAPDASEAPKATITDAELDAKLTADLEAMGYTREYFISSRTSSVESDKLKEHVYTEKGIEVTDDEVKTEYETKTAEQKEKFDADPTQYATAVNSNSYIYYVPAGYRGVKNLLIKFTDEDQAKIDELQTKVDDAQKAIDDAADQVTTLQDAEGATDNADQIAQLQNTVTEQTKIRDDAQAELDEVMTAAYANIQAKADEALARAQNGEDFDALIAELGQDDGMKSEPAKTEGYPVCAGMTTYVTEFQDAAMALEKVGDFSGLVKTKYGYHILKYAVDIASGEKEMTDEQAETLRSSLLTTKQNAAYDAAVNEWVQEEEVKETGVKL